MSFLSINRQRAAIIVAAGNSTRMGALSLNHGVPKVLFPLGASTVIAASVKAFVDAGILRIVVVANESFTSEFRIALEEFDSYVVIVPGGATRADSVRAGLDALGTVEHSSLIAVHDGARCFCSVELIEACFEHAAEFGAVTAALPAVDSMVLAYEPVMPDSIALAKVKLNKIQAMLPREKVWHVQTPQVFRAELLREAHKRAISYPDVVPTDDASLVREFHPVHLVPGDRSNFKLTTPSDYEIALNMGCNVNGHNDP